MAAMRQTISPSAVKKIVIFCRKGGLNRNEDALKRSGFRFGTMQDGLAASKGIAAGEKLIYRLIAAEEFASDRDFQYTVCVFGD